MPTPEEESSDDDLLARLGPKGLLARGLEDTGSPPPSPTPPPTPAGSGASARDQNLGPATLAEMFPEFRFEGVISRGGFGTVYRAEHRQMKRRVAVKILSSAVTRNVSAVARFEREIAAIGTLDHPGIVRAFDAGQRGGVWFLAMELVEGADLSTLSRALGPLPPAEACELIRQTTRRMPSRPSRSPASCRPCSPASHGLNSRNPRNIWNHCPANPPGGSSAVAPLRCFRWPRSPSWALWFF